MWTVLPLLIGTALNAAPVIQLELIDDQREIQVQVDQAIHIALDRPLAADARQRWILLEPPIQHILRMQRSAEGPEHLDEQPQRWQFVATGVGAQRLRFELRRSGEAKYEAERSFTVLLEVGQ